MEDKQSKIVRVLDIYRRLQKGRVINKSEEAQRFGIDERSVQRDIDDIRAFLSELATTEGSTMEVVYDRKGKGFILSGYTSPLMSNSEVLAVSKILLESRALSKPEMSTVLDKLISGCVPLEKMKLVSDLLSNEKFHYVEIAHPYGIQGRLWDIGYSIQHQHLVSLKYQRQGNDHTAVDRLVEPLSILFSEYYFYLNAYIVERDVSGNVTPKYTYPAIFRIDRIEEYTVLDEHFSLQYADRFQEGEFRKRIQFMYAGRLQNVRFCYTGASIDAILDRLPTATVKSQDDKGYIIEAEVYGKGVLMWLLSQGKQVEVLSPAKLRSEMREMLLEMLSHYQDE